MSDRRQLFSSLVLLIVFFFLLAAFRWWSNHKWTVSSAEDYQLIEFSDEFHEPRLDLKKWQITRKGDFRESVIDILDVDPGKKEDFRLRLKADTMGTRDDTVKFHGVRCIYKIDFSSKRKISIDFDWNDQFNGCYLTAAIYICPTLTDYNPEDENDWLRIEYIGVPPGKTTRCAISTKTDQRLRYVYLEGWPENRDGRTISLQKVDLIIDENGFEVLENHQILFRLNQHKLKFTSGYLYLQMSSHSNYRSREIYFDNVQVFRLIDK